jgi:hypothetical protein
MPSTGIRCHVALVRTDISVEYIYCLHHYLCSVLLLLVTAHVPSSLILFTLMMEEICSSKILALTRPTRHRTPEDGILHSHQHGNLKSNNVSFISCLFCCRLYEVSREVQQLQRFGTYTQQGICASGFWEGESE